MQVGIVQSMELELKHHVQRMPDRRCPIKTEFVMAAQSGQFQRLVKFGGLMRPATSAARVMGCRPKAAFG